MSYIKTIDVNGVATQIDYTALANLPDFVGILPEGNGRTIKFSAKTKTAMTNAGLISTIEGKHWTVA